LSATDPTGRSHSFDRAGSAEPARTHRHVTDLLQAVKLAPPAAKSIPNTALT